MKARDPLMFWAFVVLICLGSSSLTQATIVSGVEEWGTTLDAHESITCIAHYIPDTSYVPTSLVFADVPEPTSTYTIGDWTGWQTEISSDGKMVFLHGPRQTNPTDYDNLGWFSYNLFFEWDDEDPLFDPDWPVYIDTAIFDGPFECPSYGEWGWRGTPGDINWVFSPEPYAGPYTNPVPEPATLLLVGAGSLALRRKPASKLQVTPRRRHHS